MFYSYSEKTDPNFLYRETINSEPERSSIKKALVKITFFQTNF